MHLEYASKDGIFEDGVAPPVIDDVHMTIPCREALQREGHVVVPNGNAYVVTLSGKRLPKTLVAAIRYQKGQSGMREEVTVGSPPITVAAWGVAGAVVQACQNFCTRRRMGLPAGRPAGAGLPGCWGGWAPSGDLNPTGG